MLYTIYYLFRSIMLTYIISCMYTYIVGQQHYLQRVRIPHVKGRLGRGYRNGRCSAYKRYVTYTVYYIYYAIYIIPVSLFIYSLYHIQFYIYIKGVNVHVYEQTYSGFGSGSSGGGNVYKRISAFDSSIDPEMKPTVRVLYRGGVHYDALVVSDSTARK